MGKILGACIIQIPMMALIVHCVSAEFLPSLFLIGGIPVLLIYTFAVLDELLYSAKERGKLEAYRRMDYQNRI